MFSLRWACKGRQARPGETCCPSPEPVRSTPVLMPVPAPAKVRVLLAKPRSQPPHGVGGPVAVVVSAARLRRRPSWPPVVSGIPLYAESQSGVGCRVPGAGCRVPAVGRSRSGAGGRAAGDGRARTDEGRAARRYSFAVVTPQAVEAIWGRSRRYAALRATGSGARGRYGLSRCWVSWRARIASSLALASPRSPLAVRRGGPGTVRAAAGTPRPSRPSRPASPAGTGPGTPVRRR